MKGKVENIAYGVIYADFKQYRLLSHYSVFDAYVNNLKNCMKSVYI